MASARLAQDRVCQRRGVFGGDDFGGAGIADEAFAQHRLVDDSQNPFAALFQRDQRAPHVMTGDEGARAVDRIEHPAPPAGAGGFAELLAQDRIGRPLGAR